MSVEPMTDEAPNMIDLRRFLAEHVGRQGSFRLDVAEGAALIARLDAERARADAAEAERDAAVARAMPEPRLLRTVEEVEALPDGPILFRWSAEVVANSATRVATKDGRHILLGGYSQQLSWLTQAYVVALPDLPTPTAAQEG